MGIVSKVACMPQRQPATMHATLREWPSGMHRCIPSREAGQVCEVVLQCSQRLDAYSCWQGGALAAVAVHSI